MSTTATADLINDRTLTSIHINSLRNAFNNEPVGTGYRAPFLVDGGSIFQKKAYFNGNLYTDTMFGNVDGNLLGDVTGNLYGSVVGNMYGTFFGNVFGNVTGNLWGQVVGDITGNLWGQVVGDVAGNLQGDVTGNVYGAIVGNLAGNLQGDVTGNLYGNINTASTVWGDLTINGNLIPYIGNLNTLGTPTNRWTDIYLASTIHHASNLEYVNSTGNLTAVLTTDGTFVANLFIGNLHGSVTGNIVGDVTGNVIGDVIGNLVGNVQGDVVGNVIGNVQGDLIGDVLGDVFGDLFGNVYGNVIGNLMGQGLFMGNMAGNVYVFGNLIFGNLIDVTLIHDLRVVSGNLIGNVQGNLFGDVTGTLYGSVVGGHVGDVVGNVSGNLFGSVFGTLYGNLVGNLTGGTIGDVTGNLYGQVHGNMTGNLFGNIYGTLVGTHIGDLSGNVSGNLYGQVVGGLIGDATGNLYGSLQGNINGNLVGSMFGNIYGNVTGNLWGSLFGNVVGVFVGNLQGDVTGNLYGQTVSTGRIIAPSGSLYIQATTTYGNLSGNMTGNVWGTLFGNVNGDVTGNIYGRAVGNVVGNVSGNLFGTVVGGGVLGNVSGNVFGIVSGNVFGTLTGNVISPNVAITGGSIDSVSIGNLIPAIAVYSQYLNVDSLTMDGTTFTSSGALTSSSVGQYTLTGNLISVTAATGGISLTPSGTNQVHITNIRVTGTNNSIDSTPIGGTTASTANITDLLVSTYTMRSDTTNQMTMQGTVNNILQFSTPGNFSIRDSSGNVYMTCSPINNQFQVNGNLSVINGIITANSTAVGINTTTPNSTFATRGSISNKVEYVTGGASRTLGSSDYTLIIFRNSQYIIELPNGAGNTIPGREYVVKRTNGTGNIIIVTNGNLGTIDDEATITLGNLYESIRLVNRLDNEWNITGRMSGAL